MLWIRQSLRNCSLIIILICTIIIFNGCNKENSDPSPAETRFVEAGTYDVKIPVDTMDRWFKLIVPPGYDHTEPRPLLLAYHGGNLSMGFMLNNRKDLIARCVTENWVLVFTNGANSEGHRGAATWNAIHCCGQAWNHNADDIGYTKNIIKMLTENLRIDDKKIYAIGGSNGAMLVHKLAAEMPEVFAAVAENQGTAGGKRDTLDPVIKVQPKAPIPFLMIHGMDDLKVQFNGGWSIGDKRWDLPFEQTVSLWANINQCNIMNSDTIIIDGLDGKVFIIDFQDCQSNMPVKAIAIENKGHGWPGLEESGFDGTNASIDFLKQFSK